MLQGIGQVVKDTTAQISIQIKDGLGQPLLGLTLVDVRVTYLKQDGLNIVGKTLVLGEFIERGLGWYDILFDKDELDTVGILAIIVTPDPLYSGTMQQATKFVYVADNADTLAGLLQDRSAWVPFLFELADVPVGGLTPANITSFQVKKPDGSFIPVVLTASNFRELLDIGNPTGIYQVYLDHTYFDQLGSLHFYIDGVLFNPISNLSYEVVQGATRMVFIEVVEQLLDNAPVIGAGVAITDLEKWEVVAEVVTDAFGQAVVALPDGDYRLTVSRGLEILHENNKLVEVKDPNTSYQEATTAQLLAGNEGPYVLEDGDTLIFKINGGATQTVTFYADDFVAPANISAAIADYVAALINVQAHSIRASSGGLNHKQVLLETLVEGSIAKIEVLGGTAQSKLNFATTEVVGRNRQRIINSFRLYGDSFSPPYMVPSTDLVTFTYRVVDLEGRPVMGAEVNIVNKFSPIIRASDGISSVLGRRVLQFFTNDDGYLQDSIRGKPRLMKGAQVDVILKGTGIVRSITVPQLDFTLMDEVQAAEDLFTIQKPNLPPAPRM